MKHRTFFWFILPSALAMLLFIALPVISVAVQSLYVEHQKVMVTVESCGPFGCTKDTHVDAEKTLELQKAEPLGRFNGLGTYLNRSHLAVAEIGAILSNNAGFGDVVSRIYSLPLYRALAFTLTYCFLVTPLAMILGFFIALGVNGLPNLVKGPAIFLSLLPMIITPLVGALII